MQYSAALLASHYLPSLEYFRLILGSDSVLIEAFENFPKQTLRNRCYVNTTNGRQMLSVPLASRTGKIILKDIRIDYTQNWQKNHWRCLVSAYANSPFFEYFSPDFKAVYDAQPVYLIDLNDQFLTLCLKILRATVPVAYTLSYSAFPGFPVFDARTCITDKNSVNRYKFNEPCNYYQTFGNGFSNNLSIVDLIFNTGPEALDILKNCVAGCNQVIERK